MAMRATVELTATMLTCVAGVLVLGIGPTDGGYRLVTMVPRLLI